jgi:hypothetical protein
MVHGEISNFPLSCFFDTGAENGDELIGFVKQIDQARFADASGGRE